MLKKILIGLAATLAVSTLASLIIRRRLA